MKDMINTQIALNRKLQKKNYSNGQLAIFVYNYNDEPLAELSIMCNSVELAPDEFMILLYRPLYYFSFLKFKFKFNYSKNFTKKKS